MKTKVLLDTDIDIGDIDDALALQYLLAQPKCELLGITTVRGDTIRMARVASSICKAYSKEVPIYPGVSNPLLPRRQPPFRTEALANAYAAMGRGVDRVLSKWEHEDEFPRGEAVEFMRRTIRENPGEVILLSIGPKTNVALLFAMDPEVPALLKGLVSMCGRFRGLPSGINDTDPREANSLEDPHSAAMIYGAPLRSHRTVPVEVTTLTKLSGPDFRQAMRPHNSGPVMDFAEVFLEQVVHVTGEERVVFHDPLAAATVFDERLCRFRRGLVEVELASERLQGYTYLTVEGAEDKHEVATNADVERFFAHFFSTVNGPMSDG